MTNSIVDNRIRAFEAQASTGSFFVPATALGAFLIIALHSHSPEQKPGSYYQPNRTSGSISFQIPGGTYEQFITNEFYRIFDELSSSQVELDAESKEVLYDNLWDLYI